MSISTKEWRFNSQQGQHFSFLKTFSPAVRPTQPSSQCVPRHFTQEVMYPWHDTRHSPPSSVCARITSPFTFEYCINIGYCGSSVGTKHHPILWELLHSECADCPVYGNYCTVWSRLPSLWKLLYIECAVCPFYGNYCTVGVQSVHSMGITAQWVCRLSILWELLHSGCAVCPFYGNYCTVSVQTVHSMGITAQWVCRLSILWELLHSECADCPFYGNYCTVSVQTVHSMGITAQWVCSLSILWELLHGVCADCPVNRNYCTVGVQTPVNGNY
jgi:hypothetical protein